MLESVRPWAVINTAGYVRVDEAEVDRERCMRENADGPAVLARACKARGVPFVTFSSDLVFDGQVTDRAYVESDLVQPLNVYGLSKAEAERRVLKVYPRALVVRTSAFFGPWDVHNFVYHALRTLSAGESFVAADDAVVSPTYVPDLVHTTLDLMIDGEIGLWHLANAGAVTWADFALLAADVAGVSSGRLQTRSTAELRLAARRPLASALSSERAWLMPTLEDALVRYVGDCEIDWRARVGSAPTGTSRPQAA
jgi:dTDP-4-dehydrorhamnose reductase